MPDTIRISGSQCFHDGGLGLRPAVLENTAHNGQADRYSGSPQPSKGSSHEVLVLAAVNRAKRHEELTILMKALPLQNAICQQRIGTEWQHHTIDLTMPADTTSESVLGRFADEGKAACCKQDCQVGHQPMGTIDLEQIRLQPRDEVVHQEGSRLRIAGQQLAIEARAGGIEE